MAALGLVGLMIGATFTNLVLIEEGTAAITTTILLVLFGVIAWVRRGEISALV